MILSSGVYNVLDRTSLSLYGVEYHLDNSEFTLNPFWGIMINSKSEVIYYAGGTFELSLRENIKLNLNFAPGLYYGLKNSLGYVIQFNSGVGFEFTFRDGSTAGIAFHHISNGGLSKYNPGTEALVFSYGLSIFP